MYCSFNFYVCFRTSAQKYIGYFEISNVFVDDVPFLLVHYEDTYVHTDILVSRLS